MWCHYCDNDNHNTADCKAIAMFKQQKKACFEAKDGLRKKPLAFLFKEMNALKKHLLLKPEKTANSKKRKAEFLLFLSSETNSTTSSDDGEKREYLLTSSKPFSYSKTKLAKSSHPVTNHLDGSESHCQQ
jgi:hypothetical protein